MTSIAQAPPQPRARSRQWLTRAGLLLVLAGLSVLVWTAWQIWGTNIVSERKQAAATQELEQQWQAGADIARVDAGEAWAVVRIPRFGDGYAIPVLKGTSDEALASGFGQFDDSEAPGERGNFTLAGHRITHGEPLRDMPALQPGDQVIIDTRTTTYVYELDTGGDDLVVDQWNTWVVNDEPVNPDGGVQPDLALGRKLITLTTCSELFHTDDRMVAFGHLVERRPRR